jgi:hypothetical protein
MNYDQNGGQESNWEFDSQSQILLNQRSNELQFGREIHYWKDFLGGYNVLSLQVPNKLDLKKK